jgi:DNA-binding beta-propeller fold protein YncE
VGNIYVANTGRNQVRRIQESGTVNVIGTGFSSPKGVAVDARGDVYVADYGNNRIAKVVPPFVGPNHGTISIVMTATAETAVSIDASGAVYGTAAIREHTSEGFQPNVFQVIPPTTPCPTGLTCLTTINKFAGFYRPRGVATDPQCTTSCDFYVADTGLGVVDQVSQGGQVLRRIGSGLRHPYGVAADKNGNIYVSDSASRSVWMIASGS